MNLTKIEETKMPLLNRRRVLFNLDFVGSTPKKEEIKKLIATSLKTKEELIILRHIYQKFGQQKAKIIANIYDNLENLNKIEKINKKKAKKEETKKEVKEQPKEEVKDVKETKTKEQESK